MKNFSRSLLLAGFIFAALPALAEEKSDDSKSEMKGNFSKEDLDSMKQAQMLDNIANPNYNAAEYSVYYFVQKGENAVGPLLGYLKKHNNEDRVVSAVIYTLGRVGPKAGHSVPFLMKFLNDDSYDIRKTTIAALGKMGKAADPAVPEISKYLASDDVWMRQVALRSLKDIKTTQSLSLANQYENRIKLDEERKNRELLKSQGIASPELFVGPQPETAGGPVQVTPISADDKALPESTLPIPKEPDSIPSPPTN